MTIECLKSRRARRNTATTKDSRDDDTFSGQFTGVVVVVTVVLVTFTPVVIFAHGKVTISQERSGDGGVFIVDAPWSCNSVGSSLLTTSVCNSTLSKMASSTSDRSGFATNGSSVATPSGCDFETVDEELKDLESYSAYVTPACAEGLLSLVCRYMYRPCPAGPSLAPTTTATRGECLTLKNSICRDAWPLLERYLNFADGGCLTAFTGCDSLDTNHSVDQNRTTNNVTGFTDATTEAPPAVLRCINPLVPPHDPKYGPCIPPCPPGDTILEKSLVTVSKTMAYISVAVQYICSFIIIYTWARAEELRRFPHVITLFMAVLNLVRAVILSIPFVVGQQDTMCQYRDFSSSYAYGGTTFAVIQGATIQFTFLSTFTLLCCSVFNVLVVLWSSYVDNFVIRRPKLVLLFESILAIVVPLCIVLAVCVTDSYIPDWVLLLACIPRNSDSIFYSYTLPAQFFSLCGMIMCLFIIKRIKQSTTQRERTISSDTSRTIDEMALSRRFFMLVVFIPLSFLMMFTAVETYLTYQESKVARDAEDYATCLFFNPAREQTCSSSSNVRGHVAIIIIFMVYMATFSFLLVLYSFIPQPALRIWRKHREQIRNLFKRRPLSTVV